jgi:NADH dehydrogenase
MRAAAEERIVTVFGGTGFLGRHVVLHLRHHGFRVRIASRHSHRCRDWFGDPNIELLIADLHDQKSIASALAGAYGVINAVSLYVERGRETFQSVHVEAAERLARLALQASVQRLIHLSGVGSDPESPSLYIRKRGEGEQVVRTAFDGAVLIRPTVMFGPGDAFLAPILDLVRQLPVFPLFGKGLTRLQPVYVEDVAEAITRTLQSTRTGAVTYELGGPHVYQYKNLIRALANQAGTKTVLLPFPFVAWHALAWGAEMLSKPPITRNQVELMKIDNVTSAAKPGLTDLGIAARAIEAEVSLHLQNAEVVHRRSG